jgi:DNA-binding response OmpR family regulator
MVPVHYHTIMNEGIISDEAPAAASARAQTNPPPQILVVDDNSDYRQLTIDVLVDSGYRVEPAKDGAEGWDALQAKSYDLVITDNQMPRMTGIDMIERLRAAGLKVPVMMATGSLPVHEFTNKPWLYPDATLQRPFSNYVLLETVKRVLRRNASYNAHMQMLLPINL